MNSYIILGTKRYKTPAAYWDPIIITPRTVRILQDGKLDACFANITIKRWKGKVEGPITPQDANYGSIGDLRSILATKGSIAFQDHYGTSYTVYVEENGGEISDSPMWDGADNDILVEISIIAEVS